MPTLPEVNVDMARVDVRVKAKTRADVPALPGDVHMMNMAAALVLLIALGVLASGAWAAVKTSRSFALRTIEVANPLTRTSLSSLRAVAAPRVAGNFFSLDMDKARAAFESVPWVRRANVRRVWPSGLEVTIEEHRAAAFWDGGDGDDRLVNEYGEVFDANLAEVEDDGLPLLGGPEGTSRQVLTLHQRLQPLFAKLDTHIETLRVSRRGSWQAELNSGAVLELGRGSESGDTADVVARTARFVRTFAEVSTRFGNPDLKHVDMRHLNGYAIELQGVQPLVSEKPSATTIKKR